MKAKLVKQRIYQGSRDWAEHRYRMAHLLLIESKTDPRDNIAIMLSDDRVYVYVVPGFQVSPHDVIVKTVEIPPKLMSVVRRHLKASRDLEAIRGVVTSLLQ